MIHCDKIHDTVAANKLIGDPRRLLITRRPGRILDSKGSWSLAISVKRADATAGFRPRREETLQGALPGQRTAFIPTQEYWRYTYAR
jgi:hypothetical protein